MPKHSEKPLFARNISYLRHQKGYTGREIEDMSGICQTTWWSWEYGDNFPSVKHLPKICQVLEYYDLYSMMTVDLSIEKPEKPSKIDEALRSIDDLKKIIENLQN